MRPPLTLVRHTASPPPVSMPVHPDTRAAAVLRGAWEAGRERGERTGHVHGWRSGLVCGLCWGCLLTGIAAAAAKSWGWL